MAPQGTAPETARRVAFGDLKRHYHAHKRLYDEAVARVMERGWFLLGQELAAFEQEFAAWCGAPYCVGCASGTEAILLSLLGAGIERGHRVVTAANTCVPTAAAISSSGASLGLCDVEEATALMDPSALEEELRRRPAKAVVAVHLYGQAADLDALREVAERHGALLIEDAAQAHGALYKHRRIGSHGTAATCWSFYPSKNLGAFGDAGAVTTHDAELAERLRKLRNYGQATRYQSVLRGVNSRMDELQAALLRAKLGLLERWNERRRTIARRYRSEITNPALRPVAQRDHGQSCEHLFVVRSAERERLLQLLRNRGVEPQIHYPIALHEQPAYRDLFSGQRFEASERLCRQVLSLPLYPELEEDEVSYVIEQANRLE